MSALHHLVKPEDVPTNCPIQFATPHFLIIGVKKQVNDKKYEKTA